MTTAYQPAPGKLYRCALTDKSIRICRFGYHRKNNGQIWHDPPNGERPTCLWYGWRDHLTYRFIREGNVAGYLEVTETAAGQFTPVFQDESVWAAA